MTLGMLPSPRTEHAGRLAPRPGGRSLRIPSSAVARRLRRYVAAHRRNPLLGRLARASWAYLEAYRNFDYDSRTNGEARLLQALGGLRPSCVLDVGANVGDWTAIARGAMANADIHCFELVPQVAAQLGNRFADDPSVKVNPFGLAERSGEVQVVFRPDLTPVSSMLDVPLEFASDLRKEIIDAEVVTGDSYCSENGIERIDFLKIDVEGKELDVLRGFEQTLSAGGVRIVQFEYGQGSIYTKDLLRDFYEYLEGFGYVLGKVYPRYVDLRPYSAFDEDFRGPNYLAVGRDDTEVQRLLR
jgi:FkbM family methyltransferase